MRYFFHAGDGERIVDAEGEDHPDDRTAANAAVRILAEMLPERSEMLWNTLRFSVAVKDDQGRLVVVLTTMAVLDPDRNATTAPAM